MPGYGEPGTHLIHELSSGSNPHPLRQKAGKE